MLRQGVPSESRAHSHEGEKGCPTWFPAVGRQRHSKTTHEDEGEGISEPGSVAILKDPIYRRGDVMTNRTRRGAWENLRRAIFRGFSSSGRLGLVVPKLVFLNHVIKVSQATMGAQIRQETEGRSDLWEPYRLERNLKEVGLQPFEENARVSYRSLADRGLEMGKACP